MLGEMKTEIHENQMFCVNKLYKWAKNSLNCASPFL